MILTTVPYLLSLIQQIKCNGWTYQSGSVVNMGATSVVIVALVVVLVSPSEGAVSSTTPLKEVFREMRQLAEVSESVRPERH